MTSTPSDLDPSIELLVPSGQDEEDTGTSRVSGLSANDEEATTSPGPSFFVSYGREDLEVTLHLVESLQARGSECWCDVQDLLPGTRWQDDIEDAIIQADITVVLLSEHSAASKPCAEEVRSALDLGKKVVPIKLRDFESEGSELCHLILHINWIELSEATEINQTVERLLASARLNLELVRHLRDTLLLARRWQQSPKDAVLLTGESLVRAQNALLQEHGLSALRFRDVARFIVACQSAERASERRRNRIALVVFAILLSVGFLAVLQWTRALSRERDNFASLLASEAGNTLSEPWQFSSWSANARRASLLLVNAISMERNHRYLSPAVELGTLLRPFLGHHRLPWNLSCAAKAADGTAVLGTYEGEILEYDLSTRRASLITSLGEAIYALSATDDGRFVGAVLADGRALILSREGSEWKRETLPVDSAWKILLGPQARLVVVALQERGIVMFPPSPGPRQGVQVETSDRIEVLAAASPNRVFGADGAGEWYTLFPDKGRAVAGARLVHGAVEHLHVGPGREVAYAAGSGGLLALLPDRTELVELPIQHGVTAMAVDEARGLVAVAAWDGAIHLWDEGSGLEVGRLPSPARELDGLMLTPDGVLHALGENAHWSWSLDNRIPRETIHCEDGVVDAQNESGSLWVLCRGGLLKHLNSRAENPEIEEIQLPENATWIEGVVDGAVVGGKNSTFWVQRGSAGSGMQLAPIAAALSGHISAQSRHIGGVLEDDHTLEVWSVERRELEYRHQAAEPISALALVGDGKQLVFCEESGRCRLQNREIPTQFREHVFPSGVDRLAVSPNAALVVVRTSDDLMYWRTDLGRVQKLDGVPWNVFSLGFLGQNRFYVSSDNVYVFECGRSSPVAVLHHRGEVQDGVVLLEEGSLLLTIGYEGIGRLWDARSFLEIARFPTKNLYPFGVYDMDERGRFAVWGDHYEVEYWDLSATWLEATLCMGTLGDLDEEEWKRMGINPLHAVRCESLSADGEA